ncbi:transposable element Tcb1 transposase [Trichonephila clavipes]|nr:transposable element Tcb1 transposase [Trichonephila clavipes]
MRICNRWMQKGKTGRRGRSHSPQCTTLREDRQIVRMAVTDCSVAPRTQSGLSARRPLLGLPLTQNHRRLRRQWCDERWMWVAQCNEVVFTDESGICLQHHDGRIRIWKHRGERMLTATLALHRVLCDGSLSHITNRSAAHSVSTRIIRRRLQQSGLSARRPLLGLPMTQNHTVFTDNGEMKEGCGWQNGMKLSLLTSHASVCNTTMVRFESGNTV